MRIDYHMHLINDSHTDKCPYTQERIREYVAAAQSRGVDEIGITEHDHRFKAFWPALGYLCGQEAVARYPEQVEWLSQFFTEEIGEYVEALVRAQQSGFPVKVAIELDFAPGRERELREALGSFPWDYVLGSVHYLDLWAIDASPENGWPDQDVDAAYSAYFGVLQGAARSGLFDVLAHPDLIKKFGHRPRRDIGPLLDETADAIAAAGVAIEISTAGLRKPVGEIYPGLDLLRRLRERDVPITLASDAHEPEEVGADFGRAVEWARSAGYDRIALFARRERRLVPLG